MRLIISKEGKTIHDIENVENVENLKLIDDIGEMLKKQQIISFKLELEEVSLSDLHDILSKGETFNKVLSQTIEIK